ncbi:vesicle-associated membrane protein 3-like isoform X4 [Leptotrombidium deliense]|uniref:Vesicle-associated membrane protein 3-like isoform X4 n=1 Tax=Leptotrombidium deliense TaxID=299467 RepID=A0A443SUF5_9ACAR|nr:vesicle-associated membrane protein 3-like isoform X4 [Leptotrombidium deliense]
MVVALSLSFGGEVSVNMGDSNARPVSAQQQASSKRLQQTQAQVDEVVGIMKTNVEKVLERDQKLSELDDRADALQQGASQFEQQAGKLKRKYWWKNLKVRFFQYHFTIVVRNEVMHSLRRSDAVNTVPMVWLLTFYSKPNYDLFSFCLLCHETRLLTVDCQNR